MLKQLRNNVIHTLWETYRQHTVQMQIVEAALHQQGIQQLVLDHFAIIDLPGSHSGISHLQQIFATLGYEFQGQDYLALKQNDFLWMAEKDCANCVAKKVLPQVVVADFRLDELPFEVKKIIEKYAKKASPFLKSYLKPCKNISDMKKVGNYITHYFQGRDWPLPTTSEYYTVHAFNELLAWVLVFGRKPNHFTLSVHLLDHFVDLPSFLSFIKTKTDLLLNTEGGIIKGNEKTGIAQSATIGISKAIQLQDGTIQIPTDFVEFVWRYKIPCKEKLGVQRKIPTLWKDFFSGFVATHADQVIESLYLKN